VKGCHNCGHAAEVAGGKFKGVPWSQTPCASCDVVSSSAGARSFDEERSVGREEQRIEPCGSVARAQCDSAEEDPMYPLSVLSAVVRGLLSMPLATRETLCLRFQGRKYSEIAEAQGITKAAAELRHRRALNKWPELRALFVVKARKQERRKRRTRERAGQDGAAVGTGKRETC